MESRESQRDKRVQDVINGRPSGGGDSPTASAMRAREEIQGIEAERAANLERQKIIGNTRQQQLATMKQAALLGASGMAAADGGARVSPVAQQAAAMNPQTQAILQKYGVKPGPRSTTSTVQQSGPNIRTTNTTNNNIRNEIKIVQPQIPMRQQQIAVAGQGKSGNLDKFKAWLDSSFAKQANEYEIQQKEYRRREWNLARNSSKLFQKLSDSTRSLGEKMDPRNMGSTFGGQLKTLLFLFLATTIDKWWNPLMKKIASFEAGFKAVFGIPINADLEKGGAEGLSFVNRIKEFIGIDTKTEKGKATSLLGGIREVFSDGITRLIDTLKLFIEDRRIALQKINMPEFKMPDTDFNPLGKLINSAFKGVMAPATEYLGNILSALMSGSSAVTRKASNHVESTAKNTFKRSYGGRYFTSESTDFMGNLKDDSTYGMSEMLSRNLGTNDNVLRTGTLMTGLKMLEGNAQKSGGAVINPELLMRLGIGQDVISKMVASGQAQYVPYKVIMVSKTEAESEDFTGGPWGTYVGKSFLSNLLPGYFAGKGAGAIANTRAVKGAALRKYGRSGVRAIKGFAGRAGTWGMAANALWSVGEGTIDYLKAAEGNSDVVAKAVPESDPRPGMSIRLLKVTPAGFNTIKSQHGIKAFDPTDRNFRTWLEGQERNQKAIMGVRGKLVYEDQEGMEALDKGQTMSATYEAKLDEIRNRPGAWKDFSESMSNHFAAASQWVGSKINVMATNVSGNPSYARRNTIQNLYQALKTALDEKRRDLPEDKREAYARLMAAQAMHESSGNYPGGISKLAYDANNFGGVIATKNRPVYYLNNAKWSKFKDVQDWANFHVGLLDSGRYKIFDADPSDYVSTLKRGGYFEDSESNYASGVQKHLGSVNSVVGSYQYTSFEPTESMTSVTPPPTGAISLGADLSGNNIKGCSPESVKNEDLKKILKSRNTGKFWSKSRGWQLLGFDDYKSLCTAGPSTFYSHGNHEIRGFWWNTNSPYTATSVRLNGAGLKKIWNGSLGQLDSMGSGQLKPGDIGVLFGKHRNGSPSAHGMMWDGKHWVSDTVQSHGACYKVGRLGNQSAQIWRMPNFWPDDFGGGDESESGTETTYLDSNGEVYNGTFLGAAGTVAGQVLGSMGAAANDFAKSITNNGSVATTGYNPAALSASQKATIEWMKRNGATEDASGLYIYDEATNTRAYLDPNSGISKTGNIERANIMAIAYMGENGTINSYEADTEAIDAYKDRAIGKLLNIQISGGKTPDSIQTDIYIGEFGDYDSFSEQAKVYMNYHLGCRIKYNLYEVLSDGTGYTSILVPRIPLLDDRGHPIYSNDGTNNYQFGPGDLGVVKDGEKSNHQPPGIRQGWTYLFKKSGFKYKKLSSDLSETVSDFHPYLYRTLKVSITPNAMRVINGLMAYIRGELENNNLKEEFGLNLNKETTDKLQGIRDKILEVGAGKTRESVFGTDDKNEQIKKIEESVNNWKSGENKENYVTYNLDDGRSYVIDKTLGIKIAKSAGKDSPMIALANKTIFDQKNEDYNTYLRQADLAQGKLNVDIESLYKKYMESNVKDLSNSTIRREFIKRLMGVTGETVKDEYDNEWLTEVDNTGKIKYKFNFNADKDSGLLNKSGVAKKLLKRFGINSNDTAAIHKKLWEEGLSGKDFNDIFGGDVREEGPDWGDLNDVREYFTGLGNNIDVSDIWKDSKTHLSLKDSWLKENSESRVLASALIEKYNKNGGVDTEDLYNSNGTLIYRDNLGMVHAVGKVTSEEGHQFAKPFDNSEEGASQYAKANETFRVLNLGTEAGQSAMEAEYASRFGAKSLGNGNMYFEHDGKRVLFNVNDVKDHADIQKILNHEKTKFYTESSWLHTTKQQDQKADAVFGEEGWSEIDKDDAKNTISISKSITSLGEAMDAAEKAPKEKTDLERFTDSYKEAIIGISNERLRKIESNNITQQLEGHAGNIEDYTKRSAEYLQIIAGATEIKDKKDKEKYEHLKEMGLSMTQSELRAMGPVTKDQVNKVTAEAQNNTKNHFIKALVPVMQELAKSNPKLSEKAIFEAAKKQVLSMPEMRNNIEGKMMGYGGWSKGVIIETRKKQEEAKAAENKDKSDNIKNDKKNIKEKEGIQKIEAKVVKTESDTAKLQEANAKKAEAIVKQQEANAEEERKQLEKQAELLSKTETHQLSPFKPLGNIPGGDVIYNQEGAHVTINVFNKNGFNPPSYT